MDWLTHAERLATELVRPESRWRSPLATTARHLLVPRWWESAGDGRYVARDGAADPEAWMHATYANDTLVTRVGPLHADHAEPGQTTEGRPTSSSTLPVLVVGMYRHAMVTDTSRVLVTTGSGYGTALLCRRLGADRVTSIDVDPYLVEAAGNRLDAMGLRPHMGVGDITDILPGEFDRIVSTVSVRPVPAAMLAALRPGGRLVTTLAGTGLIVVADKTADGSAVGHVPQDRAGFMRTRHGDDYAPRATDALWEKTKEADGEEVTTSRYPLLYPPDAWDVWSMLELTIPGIDYRKAAEGDRRTVWMLHEDGSWARAEAPGFLDSPTVHQAGPRRLWDELERIRHRLNREGALPVYGARVRIDPDGTVRLSRGAWSVTVT
ncbi:protein-L-isoaspartate O-methyltransferase [Streptomyces sp. TRM64462]|uniref:protein-L-isoaspartate O-methyltransferase family protein n=1 Tax=Streptomyces sp. TRM64462 TaxID=2741726 RepID=UPI001586E857|nr:methyltransferase domain-containing protein [Streptomyces sp. TRM64462]